MQAVNKESGFRDGNASPASNSVTEFAEQNLQYLPA